MLLNCTNLILETHCNFLCVRHVVNLVIVTKTLSTLFISTTIIVISGSMNNIIVPIIIIIIIMIIININNTLLLQIMNS